jgi:hypothetical protein
MGMSSAQAFTLLLFRKAFISASHDRFTDVSSVKRIAGLFFFRGKAQDVTSPADGGNINKNDSTTSEINATNTDRYSGFQVEKEWTAISFNRDGNGSEAYRDKFGSLGVPKRFVFRGISVDSCFKEAKGQVDNSTVLPDAKEQAKISGRGIQLRRRIDFHPTLIAESAAIIGPPILKHPTDDCLLGNRPDAITILLAAHETGEIFYAKPILKWMVTILRRRRC